MMQEQLWPLIQAVRAQAPLVQNITNFVVMNNTANALLAVGASPIMAHAHPEIPQMLAICQALVVNIGTLDDYWAEAMRLAAAEAQRLGKPWVLDPVGAGATPYRNELLTQLLPHRPTIIRGNASEILALAGLSATTKGVDSTVASTEALGAARALHAQTGATVCVSGAVDLVVRGTQVAYVANGSPLMTKVTGLGCSATAVLGAFAALNAPDAFAAAAAGVALFSVAGELAAAGAAGPGSLQVRLLDALSSLTEAEFMGRLQLTVS